MDFSKPFLNVNNISDFDRLAPAYDEIPEKIRQDASFNSESIWRKLQADWFFYGHGMQKVHKAQLMK
jgi:hypothetical protein